MLVMILAAVGAAVALGVLYLLNSIRASTKEYPEVPCPPLEPGVGGWFWGHLAEQIPLAPTEFYLWTSRQVHKFGAVIKLRALNSVYLTAGSPDLIYQVLAEDTKYYKRSGIYAFFEPWLGGGILLCDGDDWKWRRKLLATTFGDASLREVYHLFEAMIVKMHELMEERPAGTVFDFEKDCKSLTLDIFGKAGMNFDFNALEAKEKDITESFRIVMGEQQARLNVAWMPLWLYKLTPPGRRFIKNCKFLKAKAFEAVQERRKESPEELRAAKDPMGKLMTQQIDGKGYSDHELTDDILTLMFAGHESTSCLISFALYEIMQSPEIEQRVLEEMHAVIGNGIVCERHLNQLDYLNMVLKETLRRYTPIPGISKKSTCQRDLGGFTIKPGTDVDLSLVSVHSNPKYWKDPSVFDPERFNTENMADMDEKSFCPFASGKRSCVGRAFAMLEARMFFAMTLPKFVFKLQPGQQIRPVTRINTNLEHGLLVTCSLREPMVTPRSSLAPSF